jgi:hypothetical protein
MEMRFNIDDDLVERLKIRTSITKGSDLAREAFEVFDWATSQAELGRQIQAQQQESGNNTFYVPVKDVLNPIRYT